MPFMPVAFSLVVTDECLVERVVGQLPQLDQHKALLHRFGFRLAVCRFVCFDLLKKKLN